MKVLTSEVSDVRCHLITEPDIASARNCFKACQLSGFGFKGLSTLNPKP